MLHTFEDQNIHYRKQWSVSICWDIPQLHLGRRRCVICDWYCIHT